MYSFLILSLYALAGQCKPITTAPTVTIDSGTLTGKTSPPSVNQYLGIPFGTAARFEKAKPIAPWQGIYDATSYKPTCIQQFDYPEAARNATIKWFNTPPPPGGESEDCLNINVWAPVGATPGSKPVMFWIYGGGFKFGSAALPLYQGINFAQNQDVVIVTANYRNNVFGWPGSPDIPESEQNLGFYDQRLALDWVHRNINEFGGDCERVTIFGESAGGGSVDALVSAPPDPLPFSAAIMQSGQATIFLSQHDSRDSWQKLTNLTGCTKDSLNCMRKVPATKLKDVIEHNQLKFGPIHDGITWTTNPRNDRLQSKPNNSKIARVPILIGSNRDEATVFTQGQSHQKQVGFTEVAFQCPAAVVAEDSEQVGIPSWRYYYNATFANMNIFPGAGVYHSSEIPLIFGTYPQHGATQFQKATSDMMQKAWADFAKNPTKGPGWAQVPQLAIIEGEDDSAADPTAVVPRVEKPSSVDKNCGQYKLLYGIVGILKE